MKSYILSPQSDPKRLTLPILPFISKGRKKNIRQNSPSAAEYVLYKMCSLAVSRAMRPGGGGAVAEAPRLYKTEHSAQFWLGNIAGTMM